EPVGLGGNASVEIFFLHPRRQPGLDILGAGAEVNHLSEPALIAHQVKEHAAIPVQHVGWSAQSAIRPRGSRMYDRIETVRAEVFAHRLLIQQIQFGRGRRQHLIGGRKLLRQISPNEPRPAGDEYAHYAGVRKENFLCPKKLKNTTTTISRAPAM